MARKCRNLIWSKMSAILKVQNRVALTCRSIDIAKILVSRFPRRAHMRYHFAVFRIILISRITHIIHAEFAERDNREMDSPAVVESI